MHTQGKAQDHTQRPRQQKKHDSISAPNSVTITMVTTTASLYISDNAYTRSETTILCIHT